MPKFKLVTGSHVKDTTLGGAESFYKPGDIVESAIDLEKAFGRDKFVTVEDGPEVSPKDKFEALTVAKLKELAAANNVEIPEDSKKADIVQILVDKGVK